MKEVRTAKSGIELVFGPFHATVWMTFAILWMFFSFILYSISLLDKYGEKKKRREEQSGGATSEETRKAYDATLKTLGVHSLYESIEYFSLAALHYGVERNPEGVSGRLPQWSWSIFSVIFLSAYTANLTAILTEDKYVKPFVSIYDFPKANDSIHGFTFRGTEGIIY